jgi:hypothetical protein
MTEIQRDAHRPYAGVTEVRQAAAIVAGIGQVTPVPPRPQ